MNHEFDHTQVYASITSEVSSYRYDAAGRLVSAVIPHHTLTYAFAPTGGCGVNPNAGMNGKRTSFTDARDSAAATTVSYCYDNADRLTSTSVVNPPAGANPVAGGALNTVGPSPSLVYDPHGNTTVLADQLLTYDVADRHMSTTLTNGTSTTADDTTVVYVRDVTGRIVARTDDPAGPTGATTIRYTFAAGGQFGVLNSVGTLIQRDLSLPGGASVSIPVSGGTQSWSYPNLHGDSILTADAARDSESVLVPATTHSGSPSTWSRETSEPSPRTTPLLTTHPGKLIMPGWVEPASCSSTRDRSPPSRWACASTLRPLEGSSPSTPWRVASATATTTLQTPSTDTTCRVSAVRMFRAETGRWARLPEGLPNLGRRLDAGPSLGFRAGLR